MKTIYLFALLACLFMLHVDVLIAQEKDVLNVKEFADHIDRLTDEQLVDVRTSGEFSKGYIDGAMNIDINGSDFEKHVASLNRDKPVMVYCLSGGRSAKAAEYLEKRGFHNIYQLEGGILKWNAAEMPLIVRSTFSKGMDSNTFQAHLKEKKMVLVDFHAKWCAPCKKMAPVLAEIARKNEVNLLLLKIDADENAHLVDSLQVEALPALFIFHNGKQVWSRSGYSDQRLIEEQLDEIQ